MFILYCSVPGVCGVFVPGVCGVSGPGGCGLYLLMFLFMAFRYVGTEKGVCIMQKRPDNSSHYWLVSGG